MTVASFETGSPRYCRQCGRELIGRACPDHPSAPDSVSGRRRRRRPPTRQARLRPIGAIGVGVLVVALATSIGLLAGQVHGLQADLSAASAHEHHQTSAVQGQVDQLNNAVSGLASRLAAAEGQLNSQPNLAAIAKTVDASLFVVQVADGSGSGFAVSSAGGHTEVLTNYHVVGNESGTGYQTNVKVVQNDQTYDGTVTHVDVDGDLALIDVVAVFAQLPISRLAPAAGDTLYAFGAPFGASLENTVTQGVASGTRNYQGLDRLQFSAQINPGNSGGPVVDTQGKVVGVAELSVVDSQGLFFAVPIDRACLTVMEC